MLSLVLIIGIKFPLKIQILPKTQEFPMRLFLEENFFFQKSLSIHSSHIKLIMSKQFLGSMSELPQQFY
jgi:hypothetical protein